MPSKKKKVKKLKYRKWLRPMTGNGDFSFIQVNFQTTGDYSITLSDCSRQISYDFYLYRYDEEKPNDKARNERDKKEHIKLMRKIADEFTKAADWYEENA